MDSLQSSTWTVSSQIYGQIPNTWNQTTSKSSYTYNYGDNPAKISSHMLPTNSLKGCPLLMFVHYKTAQTQSTTILWKPTIKRPSTWQKMPPMYKNSLYRTIKLQQTPWNTKLTITGPHQNYKCPLCIKLNISIPYSAQKMPPDTNFNYFRTTITSKNYFYKYEHFQAKELWTFQVKVQGHLHS